MFESLSAKLQAVFDRLGKRGILREEDVKAVLREIRLALLEADVNYKVVKDFIDRVREKAVGEEVSRALNPAQQVIKIVHQELVVTLGEPGRLELKGRAPYVIMLVGLQGSGKTTMIAKLALHLRSKGHFPLMVAADTYRPAAITQLEVLGRQINVPVYSDRTAKPPDICARSLEEARNRGSDIILLDTAGRLQIDEAMMTELVAIRERVHPIEILLVADSMTGQEAVNIAQGFHERVGLTGLILTKVDGDARGGAAISMREVTGVPIKFLGTGEKTGALEPFHPERLASRILGMGDVLSLIERAETAFDEAQAAEMEKKLRKGEFDLEDFLDQLRQVRKMGPLNELLGMIPGLGKALKGVDLEKLEAEKNIKYVEAIILSMTPEERRNPRILNASRKRRIAAGSGTDVQQINQLLNQHRQMQKMMKRLGDGKARGLPRLFQG
ncbi:MAG TPA: signal recognition particle protein [Anaerolineae bacterium]|nr:signal recognition particle protein [Anaerolineae bacterium]HQI82978.1 signal recognition particle protein [Anaerolineae bacterium]